MLKKSSRQVKALIFYRSLLPGWMETMEGLAFLLRLQVWCKIGLHCILYEWSFLSSVQSYFLVTSEWHIGSTVQYTLRYDTSQAINQTITITLDYRYSTPQLQYNHRSSPWLKNIKSPSFPPVLVLVLQALSHPPAIPVRHTQPIGVSVRARRTSTHTHTHPPIHPPIDPPIHRSIFLSFFLNIYIHTSNISYRKEGK